MKKQPTKRLRETAAARQQRFSEILIELRKLYPNPECALAHQNAFQLLVATILSAQCTDKRVNMVTPKLFATYANAASLAAADQADLEKIIHSTGFYRAKAKNLKLMAAVLAEKFASEVPRDLESLVPLAGVGRKTANVVLGTAYGIPSGVVVDTHVQRLTQRLGLTSADDPITIERELMKALPQSEWITFSHRLIHHGRAVCVARSPKCDECTLGDSCPRVGVGE